jgi:hypothetical protein
MSSSRPTPPPVPSSSHQLKVAKTIQKVRDQQYMSLFSSSGDHPLRYPCTPGTGRPDIGDLYTHTWGEGPEIQMWSREGDSLWKEVNEGHTHPQLPDHRLYKGSGGERIRWVHKKTVATYKSRVKKQSFSPVH